MGRNPEAGSPRRESIFYRLKSLEFHATRKILFSWIRPTVLGCDPASLDIESDEPVCYALPFRSLADLMVVDKACENAGLPRPYHGIGAAAEARAFFFLGHPEGRLGRKTLRQQSARMIRLCERQRHLDQAITIVPVSLFWGHQPDQEKSIFKLILSENWVATSSFKKLLAIIFHRRHILVQFSAPISLKELTDSQPDPQKQIRKLLRLLRVQFNRQKRAIIGPDLSHRRTLINSIMASAAVRNAIDKEADRSHASRGKMETRALKYANEIASHQSYSIIRFFDWLLTWLWHRLYDGITVGNIEHVKEYARACEIVYTPCHRSHVDYLLLSYVLYHNGLMPPHVAAGENLNMPLVGAFLRRGGAFFMRRSFRGDTLYRTVFDEYLHLMFVRGYSIEYFIEGGRSRSGRTLSPRTGMLSMTVRSFQRNPARPICMMPVYFSYERVIEAPTYMRELAGREKKRESILDLVRVLGTLREPFGRVTVNFGQPVLLDEFLDTELPDWRTPDEIAPRAFSYACVTLSKRIATRINRAAVVNPINLVATALLSTPRQIMEEQRLRRQVDALLCIARQGPFSDELHVTELKVAEILDEAEKVVGIRREVHTFGNIVYAPPDLTILLTWYRNNVAHVFAMPSVIARLVRSRQHLSLEQASDYCARLYPCLQAELFLPWASDEIADVCGRYLDLLEQCHLIVGDNGEYSAPEPASEEYESLASLAEIIEPTLERFYIVTALLVEGAEYTLDDLQNHAAGIAQELSTIYGINSPEFFEQSLFSVFIRTMEEESIISADDKRIVVREGFEALDDAVAASLDPDVRYNVLQAIQRRKVSVSAS